MRIHPHGSLVPCQRSQVNSLDHFCLVRTQSRSELNFRVKVKFLKFKFETMFHYVAQSMLDLDKQSSLAFNSWFSYLS